MIGRKNLPRRLLLIFYCLGRKSEWEGGLKNSNCCLSPPLWSRVFPAFTVSFVQYFSFSMGGLFLSWFILSCCEPLVRMEAMFFFFMALECVTRHLSQNESRDFNQAGGQRQSGVQVPWHNYLSWTILGPQSKLAPLCLHRDQTWGEIQPLKWKKICTFSSGCS